MKQPSLLQRFEGWIIGGWGPGGATFNELESLVRNKFRKFFGAEIEMSPRVMDALVCRASFYKYEVERTKFTNFGADDILSQLIKVSPLVTNHLLKSGFVNHDFRMADLASSVGYPTAGLYKYLFTNQQVIKIIKETLQIDEFTLLRAIIGDGYTSTLSNAKIPIETVCRAPVYDEAFRLESKNFELLCVLDDDDHLQLHPFGAAGLIVDGSVANLEERPKRLNFAGGLVGKFLSNSSYLLAEYERLINDPKTAERDIQTFFEENPFFLSGVEYDDVRPHLILAPDDGPKMIPDFFLEPTDYPYMDLFEIKKPATKLVTRRANGSRVRLTQAVRDGIAQLLEYRRFFENPANRLAVTRRYGVRAYKPKMTLIIGRDWDLRPRDRIVNLAEEIPQDVEVMTYDAILERVRRWGEI